MVPKNLLAQPAQEVQIVLIVLRAQCCQQILECLLVLEVLVVPKDQTVLQGQQVLVARKVRPVQTDRLVPANRTGHLVQVLPEFQMGLEDR